MSSAQVYPINQIKHTVERYLAFERASSERHEYVDGEIIGMAGEKLPHGIISANIVGIFVVQLKGTPCFAVTKDAKVRSGLGLVSSQTYSGMFSYPDVVVICGEPEYFDEHQDVIANPTAIVEVLSKSTEAFDRGEKFQRYRTWNPALKEYVLVSQTRPHLEHFSRQPDDQWIKEEAIDLAGAITLPSISCTLRLAEVYDRVVFGEEGRMPT